MPDASALRLVVAVVAPQVSRPILSECDHTMADAESEARSGPFTPLDRQQNHIRLLRLTPGQHGYNQIRCEMQTYALDAYLLYTALSYEWGTIEGQHTILVNGFPVPVRRNLWLFLKRVVRQPEICDDLIWIDALCIDQSINEERSHQVNLMAQIYQSARLVIAWLGPCSKDSHLAFDSLEAFGDILHSPRRLRIGDINAVVKLCRQSYWSRLWVLQELVLAERCVICDGERSVPITYLEALLGHAALALSGVAEDASEPMEVTALRALLNSPAGSMLKQRQRGPPQTPLLARVLACGKLECADPKDKVYALLGISQSSGLLPDYGVSVAALFNDLLRKCGAFDSCASLGEVSYVCEQLVKATGLDRGTLFPLYNSRQGHHFTELETDNYPLIHRASGVSLWWMQSFGHLHIQQLWLAEATYETHMALHTALNKGHERVVQMLLDAGVDVDSGVGGFDHALQMASYRGHEKVVKMLLVIGANVNARGAIHGNALQAASYRGHEKVVQILLDAGADVNAQVGWYGSALQAASCKGHEMIVRMLLDAGTDIASNAPAGNYSKALHAALQCGHDKIVQMLRDARAVGANEYKP